MGIFKKHITAQNIKEPLHVDALGTLIIEIEAIVNKRPITALSADPRDFEAFTPAHILYPSFVTHSSATIVPTTSTKESDGHRASWTRVQARVNCFWKQFKEEYVTALHARRKWTTTHRDLCIGDLTIMVDENTYRGDWRLARVINVISDGTHIRSAEVKTSDGKTFLRDRRKLVLLELDGDEDSSTLTFPILLSVLPSSRNRLTLIPPTITRFPIPTIPLLPTHDILSSPIVRHHCF